MSAKVRIVPPEEIAARDSLLPRDHLPYEVPGDDVAALSTDIARISIAAKLLDSVLVLDQETAKEQQETGENCRALGDDTAKSFARTLTVLREMLAERNSRLALLVAAMPEPEPAKEKLRLYKTNIVIWSEDDPTDNYELVDIAREATEGCMYCSSMQCAWISDPENDPDFDGTEFFTEFCTRSEFKEQQPGDSFEEEEDD